MLRDQGSIRMYQRNTRNVTVSVRIERVKVSELRAGDTIAISASRWQRVVAVSTWGSLFVLRFEHDGSQAFTPNRMVLKLAEKVVSS
jgi:hypothetical protein